MALLPEEGPRTVGVSEKCTGGLPHPVDSRIVPKMKPFLCSLAILTAATGSTLAQAKPGGDVVPVPITLPGTQAKLEPGQFEWHPERSPEGPLLVVCTLPATPADGARADVRRRDGRDCPR